MCTLLFTAAKSAVDEGRASEGKVLWLLGDAVSMMLKPDSINQPYSPNVQWVNGSRSAIAEDFQDAELDLFAEVCLEIGDFWIGARLADIVWLRRRNHEYALRAIDFYRQIPTDHQTWLYEGRDCWERAIVLARQLGGGAAERIEEIEQVLVDAFKQDSVARLDLAEVLYENNFGARDAALIAKRLSDWATTIRPQDGQDFYKQAGMWYCRGKDEARSHDMTTAQAEAWVQEAEHHAVQGVAASSTKTQSRPIGRYPRKNEHREVSSPGYPNYTDA